MRRLIKRRPAWSFSVVVVLWTWLVLALIIALNPIDPVQGPQFVHVALVFFVASPTVLGFIFARIADGKSGVRELLRRAVRWRVSPIWYAASLFLIPALLGLGVLIRGWLGTSLASLDLIGNLLFAIPIALLAAVMEEFGWRGFLLPKLLERTTALRAALLVGLVWALWHAPINYLGLAKYGLQAIPIMLVLLLMPIVQTVIMVWIHNSGKHSMLLMVLTHFSITAGFIVFALPANTASVELEGNIVNVGMMLLAALVIVAAAGVQSLSRSRN